MKERFHSLDALRAFALLLGVALHSAMSFMLPPGFWAVGTTDPATVPSMFVFYVHSFRMEVFFLLAGFFSHLVIGKRGLGSFLRDRCQRIILVFVVALYPMKFLSSAELDDCRAPHRVAPTPSGGFTPRLVATRPRRVDHGIVAGHQPHALLVPLLFDLDHRPLSECPAGNQLRREAGKYGEPICPSGLSPPLASWFAPLILVVVTLPLMGAMDGAHVETPDKTFVPNLPVLALYGVFFVTGWRGRMFICICRKNKPLSPTELLVVGTKAKRLPAGCSSWPRRARRSSKSICSALRLAADVISGAQGSNLVISWASSVGRSYVVEQSADLHTWTAASSWQEPERMQHSTPLPANGADALIAGGGKMRTSGAPATFAAAACGCAQKCRTFRFLSYCRRPASPPQRSRRFRGPHLGETCSRRLFLRLC